MEAMVAAPVILISLNRLCFPFAEAGFCRGAVRRPVTDEQVRPVFSQWALQGLLTDGDGFNNGVPVRPLPGKQFGVQFPDKSFLIGGGNSALALAALKVKVKAIQAQRVSLALRPVDVTERSGLGRLTFYKIPLFNKPAVQMHFVIKIFEAM